MKRMVHAVMAILVSVLMLLPFAGRAGGPPDKPSHIVIQINEDDSKKWHGVLANIRNIQSDLGRTKVRIALVAIGPGLGMLAADSLSANEVQDAIAAGVEFVACGNSMKAQHIGKEDLVEGVRVVQAGYVEVVRRQEAGWSYLRP